MAKKKSLFKHVNPEILAWSGKHDLPRFDRIANTDFAPAFEAAMKSGLGEIDAIAGQNKKPGFKNTIVALSFSSLSLFVAGFSIASCALEIPSFLPRPNGGAVCSRQ